MNVSGPADRPVRPGPAGWPLFAYGFRPFFLLAGLHAAIVIPAWLGLLHGILPAPALAPQLWHPHEMLFGFTAAAVAGFLLTAVPSWTGQRGYAGTPLIGLVLLWLAGRVVMSVDTGLPAPAVAVIDLALIPALALLLLPALLRSGNRRNLVFIALLLLLFVSNLRFHLSGGSIAEPLSLGFNAMLFMLTLLGGRVVPAFTASVLREREPEARIRRFQPLDRAALASVGVVVAVDLVAAGGRLAAVAALLAALLLGLQLCRWQGHRTLAQPIVWILHLAYAWLPLSLLLKSLWLFALPLPSSSWQHALGVGAMATMILAIMTRASLGHTGRALRVAQPIVAAYLLLTAAALMRVFAVALAPAAANWLLISGICWSAAFLLFLAVYTPILLRPRADGKPG